jgi:hypothetical protein
MFAGNEGDLHLSLGHVQILTSPLSSKKHSRVPFSVLRGPTASSLTVKVFPFSIEMDISSPMDGLAKK